MALSFEEALLMAKQEQADVSVQFSKALMQAKQEAGIVEPTQPELGPKTDLAMRLAGNFGTSLLTPIERAAGLIGPTKQFQQNMYDLANEQEAMAARYFDNPEAGVPERIAQTAAKGAGYLGGSLPAFVAGGEIVAPAKAAGAIKAAAQFAMGSAATAPEGGRTEAAYHGAVMGPIFHAANAFPTALERVAAQGVIGYGGARLGGEEIPEALGSGGLFSVLGAFGGKQPPRRGEGPPPPPENMQRGLIPRPEGDVPAPYGPDYVVGPEGVTRKPWQDLPPDPQRLLEGPERKQLPYEPEQRYVVDENGNVVPESQWQAPPRQLEYSGEARLTPPDAVNDVVGEQVLAEAADQAQASALAQSLEARKRYGRYMQGQQAGIAHSMAEAEWEQEFAPQVPREGDVPPPPPVAPRGRKAKGSLLEGDTPESVAKELADTGIQTAEEIAETAGVPVNRAQQLMREAKARQATREQQHKDWMAQKGEVPFRFDQGGGKFIVVAKSTKPEGGWTAGYFDEKGPYMDIVRDDYGTLLKELQGTDLLDLSKAKARTLAPKPLAPPPPVAPMGRPKAQKPSPEVAPAAPAKQPWEMTREEWATRTREANKAENAALRLGIHGKTTMEAARLGTDERLRLEYGVEAKPIRKRGVPVITHEAVIRKALSEGKPVPPEVLADYPDLALKQAEIAPKQPEAPPSAKGVAKSSEALGKAKQAWESIPRPREAKFRHYGTVESGGMIAYKIGRGDTKATAAARKAGYWESGGGSHYEYWTRGEPKQYQRIDEAMKSATEYAFSPDKRGTRWELFNNQGRIFSSVRETKDIDKARAALQAHGLRERNTASEAPSKPEAQAPKAQGTVKKGRTPRAVKTKPETEPPRPIPYLMETIEHGGWIRSRSAVIEEMRRGGASQAEIDAYMAKAQIVDKWGNPIQPLGQKASEALGKAKQAWGDLQKQGIRYDPKSTAEAQLRVVKHTAEYLYHKAAETGRRVAQVAADLVREMGESARGMIRAAQREAQNLLKGDKGSMVRPARGQRGAIAIPRGDGKPKAQIKPVEGELPKYAGNINLDKLNTPEEVKAMIFGESEGLKSEANKQKRGVRSWEQTKEAADKLGWTLADVRKMQKGCALNAEQLQRVRQVHLGLAEEVSAAKKAFAESDTTINKARLLKALSDYQASYISLTGATAEAGRALNQQKIIVDALKQSTESAKETALRRMLDALKSNGLNDEALERLSKIADDDIVGLNKWMKDYAPRDLAGIHKYWMANVLSGLTTHGRNTISNSIKLVEQATVRTLQGPWDALFGKLDSRNERVLGREGGVFLAKALVGIPEGFRKGLHILQHGFSLDEAAALEVPTYHELRGGGKVPWNWPGRALLAADVLVRTMTAQGEIAALATRRAYAQGLRGQALAKRTAEIIANPPKDIVDQSMKLGRAGTFTDKPDQILQAMLMLRGAFKIPWYKGTVLEPLRFVLPFLQVPYNVAKGAVRLSPLGYLELLSSNARQGTGASEIAARSTLGSVLLAVFASMAAGGNLTGAAPRDLKEREEFYRSGKIPYAFRVGDKWVSYQNLGPISFLPSTAASFYDAYKQDGTVPPSKKIMQALSGIGQGMLDLSSLASLNAVFNAVQDPDRYAESPLSNVVSGFLPGSSALRNIANATDPIMRKPEGVLERVQSGIPGMNKELFPRQDAWGRDVQRKNSGWQGFSPIQISTETKDRVDQELIRLGVPPKGVGESFKMGGETIKLDRKQDYAINKAVGKDMYEVAANLINDPNWNTRSDDNKRMVLERIFNRRQPISRRRHLNEMLYP